MASPEEIAVAEQIIRSHVLRSYQNQGQVKEAWRILPEIPDGSDFTTPHPADSDTPERWDDYQFQDRIYYAPLPHNPIDGPWPSKQEYITAHYEILREDAIAPLRKSVKTFKNHPNMNDDENTHVYTHVSSTAVLRAYLLLILL
jgi:helicase required for RNAi-mediated heterochromatin assembly 1